MFSTRFRHRFSTAMSGTAVVVATSLLAASCAQAQDYVVKPGDSLMLIAQTQLGSAARWVDICALNRDKLEKCDVIFTGMSLRLSAGAASMSEPAATPAPQPEASQKEVATQPEPVMPADPAQANMLPDSVTMGAEVGVLGKGGKLPAHWNHFFNQGSAGTVEVVGVTADWIDLRIDQTGDKGVTYIQFAKRGAFLETTPGQKWMLAVELALLENDGSNNWDIGLQGSQWRNDETSLGALIFASDLSLGSDLTRFSGTAVTNAPEATLVHPDIRVVSSGPWTATFRIARPFFAKFAG